MGAKEPVTASCRRMGPTRAAGPARLLSAAVVSKTIQLKSSALSTAGACRILQSAKQSPMQDVWEFDQQPLIDAVKSDGMAVAGDYVSFRPSQSAERQNFDLAATGYIYVPTAVCGNGKPPCRVHLALHGCAQNPKLFAQKSGYNNWAEYYRTIIVYPAIKSRVPWWWDYFLGTEPNPLGCWDWWGYLDPGTGGDRYLTKDAPQIKVIEGIIVELTKPLP